MATIALSVWIAVSLQLLLRL